MRISDWSADVCSSDLATIGLARHCQRPLLSQGRRITRSARSFASGQRRACTICCLDNWRRAPRPTFSPPRARRAPDSIRRGERAPRARDRKSTRLNSVTNAHLVCRLLLEKKKRRTNKNQQNTSDELSDNKNT